MKEETIKSYPYIAAGKTWVFPEIILKRDPTGNVVVPGTEIDRMQRAIANEICGSPVPLTGEELEFLCNVTATLFADVASYLKVAKGSVSGWKRNGKGVPLSESLRVKKWFWHKVFGESVGTDLESVPMATVVDDGKLLEFLKATAVQRGLAMALPGDARRVV